LVINRRILVSHSPKIAAKNLQLTTKMTYLYNFLRRIKIAQSQWKSTMAKFISSVCSVLDTTRCRISNHNVLEEDQQIKIEYFLRMDIVKLDHCQISCGSQRVWKVDVMCVRNTPFHCIYWAFCEFREARLGRDQLGLR